MGNMISFVRANRVTAGSLLAVAAALAVVSRMMRAQRLTGTDMDTEPKSALQEPDEQSRLKKLESLTIKELKERARSLGVDQDNIDSLDDLDGDEIKAAAIELVVGGGGSAAASFRAELEALSIKDLKKRARALGMAQDSIDDLDDLDGDGIKAAAIELVVAAHGWQPRGSYRTCLDRPFVQKEIRWARKCGKKFIIVFEKDPTEDDYFDYTKATERYKGTEWEFVLAEAGIPYQQGGYQAVAMMDHVLAMAKGGVPAHPSPKAQRFNDPGRWGFFLSHHRKYAGLKCKDLHSLLKGRGKTAWFDREVVNPNTRAMQEGVEHSTYFVLFLTANPAEMQEPSQSEQSPEVSPEPRSPSALGPNDDAALVQTRSSKTVPERAANYSDRAGLRQEILQWAEQDSGPGGCLLMGHAGTGKTTLLTELTEDEESPFHSFVLAKHFCEYTSTSSRSLLPSTFVRNFTKQIYNEAPLYKDLVDRDEQLYPNVHRVMEGNFNEHWARVLLKRADPHASEADRQVRLEAASKQFQRQDGVPLEDFKEFALDPLKAAYGSERPTGIGHVLVVDSLDEALLIQGLTSTITAAKGIVPLLQMCHTKGLFPAWLKVLASSRDVPQVSNLRSWHRIELSDDDGTRHAIRAYINGRLADPTARGLHKYYAEPLSSGFQCKRQHSQHFERLLQKCEGTFLYAKTFMNDLNTNLSSKLEDISNLPPGMSELYCHFFDRLFGNPDSQSPGRAAGLLEYIHVRPAFEAIAASDCGVSEELVLECLRLADPAASFKTLGDRLRSVRQFLKEIAAPEPGKSVLRCDEHHELRENVSDKHFCDMCYAKGTSHRCDSCDWDLCAKCSTPPAEAPTGVPRRLTFYHLALQQWLTEDVENEWYVEVNNGHRALGVTQFAALAVEAGDKDDLFDRFAVAAVKQLGCHADLQGSHIRQMHRKLTGRQGQGGVYDMARHLGKAIYDWGLAPNVIGELVQEANVDLEDCWRFEGEWFGTRPVCQAAGTGHLQALNFLVASGADFQCSDGGLSPLHWAARKNREDVVLALARDDKYPELPQTRGGLTPLHVAAKGYGKALRALLLGSVDVNVQNKLGETALHLAAAGGFVNELKLLCNKGARTDIASGPSEFTPLHLAAQNGRGDAVKLLVGEFGVDVNALTKVKRTALHLACSSNADSSDGRIVQLLCEAGHANLEAQDLDNWTALHWACARGKVASVRLLLGAHADTSAVADNGATALHWACNCPRKARMEMVDALLDAHARVDLQTTDGATALHWACKAGSLDAVRRLHKHGGVALQATGERGEGLLHWASAAGKDQVVQYLVLEGSARVDAQDAKGKTALHAAAEGGRLGDKKWDEVYADGAAHTIKMLVNQFDAPVNATTGDGKTALQLATVRLEKAEKSHNTGQIEASSKVVSLLQQLTVEPTLEPEPEPEQLDFTPTSEPEPEPVS